MDFLIICSYFPPDSAVAAVRPYMLAKHLTKQGHHVTVLRSGAFHKPPDNSYGEYDKDFEVISYLGSDSDAERFRSGTYIAPAPSDTSSRKLPPALHRFLSRGKKVLLSPVQAYSTIQNAKKQFALQRACIDQLAERHFDVVFSTYANLENIYAGEYASRKLHAKWIQDFRDTIVWYEEPYNFVWNAFAAKLQRKALKRADFCTCISDGLRDTFLQSVPEAAIQTLYNGYEAVDNSIDSAQPTDPDALTFCYTGQFYEFRVSALEGLLSCLSDLVQNETISLEKLRFLYAGSNSSLVREVFSKYGLDEILEDHGYVSRQEAQLLQSRADVFLVLSWNTKLSQGILTGKFYEGIRAGKPILSVLSGDLPGSELMKLQEKYHYGFCYECCQKKTQYAAFTAFLEDLYTQKIHTGKISYEQNESLKDAFQYETISAKLIEISQELISRDANDLK